MGDYSHAWGATATLQLMRNSLGLKIIEAGCTVMELSPHIASLGFIEGVLPVPQGMISLRMERNAATLRITIESPIGCRILAKMAGYALISRNGKGFELNIEDKADEICGEKAELLYRRLSR